MEIQTRLVGKDDLISWHRLAQRYAFGEKTCSTGWKGFNPSPDSSCDTYHGNFALFSALSLVSSPSAHEEWYDSCLGAVTVDRSEEYAPAVLVSGLATPHMAKFAREFSFPNSTIHITDICPTPLAVCKESLSLGPRDQVFQSDITDGEEIRNKAKLVGGYSGIVTDAFITRFSDPDKEIVVKNLASVLRPESGALITTWKVDEGEAGRNTNYGNDNDKQIWLENVVHFAKEIGVPLDLNDLGAAIEYAERMNSYGGWSQDKIQKFMERHFEHVRIEISPRVYDVTYRKYARIWAQGPRQ